MTAPSAQPPRVRPAPVAPPVAAFDVVVEAARDHQVLTVTGDLDHGTHQRLVHEADRLLGAGATRLLLDLGAVGFCDSTGLGALVRLHRRTEASGGWLRLAGPGPDLRRMLAVTNLDRLLAVYATVPDAAAAPGDRPAASTPP